jgi:hypothetical protein
METCGMHRETNKNPSMEICKILQCEDKKAVSKLCSDVCMNQNC